MVFTEKLRAFNMEKKEDLWFWSRPSEESREACRIILEAINSGLEIKFMGRNSLCTKGGFDCFLEYIPPGSCLPTDIYVGSKMIKKFLDTYRVGNIIRGIAPMDGAWEIDLARNGKIYLSASEKALIESV